MPAGIGMSDNLFHHSLREDGSMEQGFEENPGLQENTTKLEHVIQTLEHVSEQVEQLAKQFEERFLYDEKQEKIMDQMHAELQNYRNDLYASLIKPILIDIIEVVDNIRKAGITYAAKGKEQAEAAFVITDFIEDLHYILSNYGVDIYKATAGEPFIPVRQRILSTIATNNLELNGKVSESMGFGYFYKGKVLWPEKVTVYKYQSNS